jgi:hypothetical protein
MIPGVIFRNFGITSLESRERAKVSRSVPSVREGFATKEQAQVKGRSSVTRPPSPKQNARYHLCHGGPGLSVVVRIHGFPRALIDSSIQEPELMGPTTCHFSKEENVTSLVDINAPFIFHTRIWIRIRPKCMNLYRRIPRILTGVQ